MRRLSLFGSFLAVFVAGALVGAGGSAEAGGVRDRIMAKRAAAGWDCSGGDCRLPAAGRTPSTQQAAPTRQTAAPAAAQPTRAAEAPAPAPTSGPKRIEISLARQQLQLLQGDRVLLSTAVSTGARETPTPTGNFSILSKELKHWSTQHHVWMPYAMRVVNGIYIHEVSISPDGQRLGEGDIGNPASHGCIRVPVGTAARLYDLSHVGLPVTIR